MALNENENESESDVQLYIYDMSKGLAKAFSAMIIGRELPGIWHTGIVVYGREYFFGSFGIESCNAGETMLGEPDQIIQLGKTQLPYSLFLEYIFSLSESIFAPGTYGLFEHNCNNFSNELSIFLTGKSIPKEIVDLPNEILNTPIGQVIRTYLSSINVRPQGIGVNFGGASHGPIKSNHNQTSKQIDTYHRDSSNTYKSSASKKEVIMASESKDETDPNGPVVDEDTDKGETNLEKAVATRKVYKYDDPPIIFKEVDGVAAIKKLTDLVQDLLTPEEQQYFKELNEYLTTDSGAWAIGNEHLDLISLLLSGGGGKFAPNVPLLVLEVLQAASLKEDFILILHQDRKDHRLMSYINKIESLTLAEQEEIAKLLCNLCSQSSTFDWLLYISEWNEADGQMSSNSRVTTRAAVHTVLNDKLTTLQKTGVSLIFNLALKELFDDVATELATAVLQFLHSDLQEEQAFLCLTSIIRFMSISYNDVPALVKMLGPDLSKYKGKSERIDSIVEQINTKLTALFPTNE